MNTKSLTGLVASLMLGGAATAAPVAVLFVGNSYTFGRVDPVMSYNAANVHDLTAAMWAANASGSNVFEPHPWGGVPGIFKQFTVEAGLDYDVSLSTRNAASLRGHLLNTNNLAGWNLPGNIAAKRWDQVVLQEQSDEPLPKQTGLASNPEYFKTYASLIEDYVHAGTALSYRERDLPLLGNGSTSTCMSITGTTTSTACNTVRTVTANSNANAAAGVYLYETWARPNLINAPFTTVADPVTGAISYTTTPATSFYPSLEAMTTDLHNAYYGLAAANPDFKGVAPVGDAFLLAVTLGLATRNFYASDAKTDGLIDLWFDDGTHASKYGSYLSALTLFGELTGINPSSLGAGEIAARDLGISSADALTLQRVASLSLGLPLAAVPEPATGALTLVGLAAIGAVARRVRRQRQNTR